MILNEQYFKLSNVMFHYGLAPIQFAVYSYLVCCAGQKEKCWPSMKTISFCCGCSINAARAAVDVLVARGFIRRAHTYQNNWGERSRQTNNTYFILPLPECCPIPKTTFIEQPQTNNESLPPCEATVKDLSTFPHPTWKGQHPHSSKPGVGAVSGQREHIVEGQPGRGGGF